MKAEDVWGDWDSRWGIGIPRKRWKRLFWRCAAILCLVLLFGISSELPKAPSDVVFFANEAAGSCDAAVEGASNCSTAIWVACEEALEYWLDTRSNDWQSWHRHDVARFLPQSFLCRSAHMAELAELGAVLADKYGNKFWEVKQKGLQGVPVLDNFWSFRVLMTYTPWVYFDLYPSSWESAHNLRNPRWLSVVSGGPMSRATLKTLNSVLGSVADFTEIYDSWPDDLPDRNDPKRSQEIETRTSGLYWPPYLFMNLDFEWIRRIEIPWEIPDVDIEEITLCKQALVSARINQSAWESRINDCVTSVTVCDSYLPQVRNYCRAMGIVAETERMWQQLPDVCANTQLTDTPNDTCRQTALEICRHGTDARNALDWFPRIRFKEIKASACALATPLRSLETKQS